jgi:hypothetical protein
MHDDSHLLRNLRTGVESEIDRYVYGVPEDAVGKAMKDEEVQSTIEEMRGALVDPYWIEIELRGDFEQVTVEKGPKRRCIVVADDRKGYLLLWDPVTQDYKLAQCGTGLPIYFGVNGDAVGTFFSR